MTAERPVVSVDTRLAEIEQREQEATAGPWKPDERYVIGGEDIPGSRPGGEVIAEAQPSMSRWPEYTIQMRRANAEFIAHARADVPWLLSQLRDARAENERLTIKAGQAMQDAVAWRAVVQNRSITEIMGERDDLRTRLAAAEQERDLAIAHDRQPYPTAWAYEQARRVMREAKERAERAEAALAAVREWRQSISGWVDPIRPRDILRALDAALAATEQDEPKRICGFNVGDTGPCRCLLPRGHAGLHQCEHTIDAVTQPTEGAEQHG